MEHALHRYFMGALAFAGVLTLFTVGIVAAVVAVAACAAAVYVAGASSRPRLRRPHRTRPPHRAARSDPHELVPDDPSLILSTYP